MLLVERAAARRDFATDLTEFGKMLKKKKSLKESQNSSMIESPKKPLRTS
jgi:hypothetical protein